MAFAPRRSVYDDRPDSMVHICRQHGVRLTAFRLKVAAVFDDTDAPLDALEVWRRMQAKGIAGALSSVYRLMREMRACGAISLAMVRDRREFFQKQGSLQLIELQNVADRSITQVSDQGLLALIGELAAKHGYRLEGRIVVNVTPATPA